MYIQQFRLLNYKSYIDSQLIQFSPGINIVIGQNNSGKTALLETLTLKLDSKPHRSLQTLRYPYSKIDEKSWAKVKIALEKVELKEILQQLTPPLGIPCPAFDDYAEEDPDAQIEIVKAHVEAQQKRLDSLETVEISFNLSSAVDSGVETAKLIENGGTFATASRKFKFIQVELNESGVLKPNIIEQVVNDEYAGILIEELGWKEFEGSIEETITYKIFDFFRSYIYRFYAERLNVGSCPYTGSSELKPDASNLAEVLKSLSTRNSVKFDRLKKAFSNIFPQLGTLTFSGEDSQAEVRVWTQEATKSDREDLSLSISDCGTGISQVLAILYVVFTSNFPRTIIIDEPQSFLHPGAAKKLIEVIKQIPQHQYIISTHSPMIIGAATPCQIIQITYDNSATTASIIRAEETDKQRAILADVGVRLSDVFGADNILWVEGETEELCFPII